MKITFDNIEQNRNVDKGYGDCTNTYRGTLGTVQMNQVNQSGVKVDIADRVMDNGAYRSQGKTMKDVMQVAQGEDATVQKNYMTVMSHSVSGEDLKEMEKDGYNAGDMDVDSYVTIVDKIKVTLAESGVTIDGYNDDLDQDKVTEITGSVATAKELTDAFTNHNVPKSEENYEKAAVSYEKAASLSSIKDSTMAYLVQNEKDPTIENLYLAQFSTTEDSKQSRGYFSDGSGYYARKAENYNWEQLEGQIAKVCENAGFAADDTQALENGKWLIQKGIPLTEENLEYLTELKQMSLPKDGKEIAEDIATAIENGKEPENTLLTGEISYTQQGKELIEQVASITPEAVDATVAQGKKINIKNLSAAQRQITEESLTAGKSRTSNIEITTSAKTAKEETTASSRMVKNAAEAKISVQNTDAVTAKRQLAEVQLTMTVEANRKLLSSGYQIDTTDLEKLIKDLKQVENEKNAILFQGADEADNTAKAALFEESTKKAIQMATMPAAVIGRAIQSGDKFTINYVVEEGSSLKKAYDTAGQSYETLMTSPRKDLGDSIQKAFANVDDILSDLNQETNEQNRRAVRILGYNQMQMNQDNLEAVMMADLEVNSVMKKLTPSATLSMIRENVNPLTMSMSELDDYLSQKEQSNVKESEKYSEYLYKLEQNHQITQDERESYVGIYRLLRQVEKGDGAAIGTVINNGAELSMNNLLSAIRSDKAKGMNVSVDNEFGALESVKTAGKSISEQIETGFSGQASEQNSQSDRSDRSAYQKKLASDIKDTLTLHTETVQGLDPESTMNMTLEQLKDTLLNADMINMREERANAYSEQYYQETLENVQKLQDVEQSMVQELMYFKQPVTMDNIMAATVLRDQRGTTFRRIADIAEGLPSEAVDFEETASDIENTVSTYGFDEAVQELASEFIDEDSAQNAYQKMIEKAEDVLERSIDTDQVNSVDVKAVNLLFKQLSLASGLAKEENFEIPISIEGENTSMNLRILRDTTEKGKVTVTMDTENLGKIAAEFEVVSKKYGDIDSNKGISNEEEAVNESEDEDNTMLRCEGFIVCDSQSGFSKLQAMKEEIAHSLQQVFSENTAKGAQETIQNGPQVQINVISSNTLDISKFGGKEMTADNGNTNTLGHNQNESENVTEDTAKSMEAAQQRISTKDLYKVAKAFIQAIA